MFISHFIFQTINTFTNAFSIHSYVSEFMYIVVCIYKKRNRRLRDEFKNCSHYTINKNKFLSFWICSVLVLVASAEAQTSTTLELKKNSKMTTPKAEWTQTNDIVAWADEFSSFLAR